MAQSSQDQKHIEKAISRRDVLKGGAATAAGAFAAFMTARRGSAAVTGMDSATLTSTDTTTKKGKKDTRLAPSAVTGMD